MKIYEKCGGYSESTNSVVVPFSITLMQMTGSFHPLDYHSVERCLSYIKSNINIKYYMTTDINICIRVLLSILNKYESKIWPRTGNIL